MNNWINESTYSGKPFMKWIEPYQKENGSFVRGHFRTNPNETSADNLSQDVDNDGINGFFDSDADGDGIFESIDINNDGISDFLTIEGDSFLEALTFIF